MTSDLRSALRALMTTPGITAAAVLSLTLGIGANATIFGWVKAVLLEPLPGVERQAEIVVPINRLRNGDNTSMSYPDYRDYRDRVQAFAGLAVSDMSTFNLGAAEAGRRPERLYGSLVSANYFDVLGVHPQLGRLLIPADDGAPGASPVVVISDAVWRRRFAADPSIVGQSITVNALPFTVAGVAPPEFQGTMVGIAMDLWVPVMMQPQLAPGFDRLEARGVRWMQAVARLKPGVSIEQAHAEASVVAQQLERAHPTSNDGYGMSVVPVWRSPFGAQFVLGPVLLVLTAIVGLVLLLACANVANILLSRTLARRREIAIRLAIGASRGRVVRQLMTESLLLAFAGAAGGLALAYFGSGILMAFGPPTDIPVKLVLGVDWKVALYSAGLALATGLLFGLAPAVQGARPDVVNELKDEAGGSAGRGRARLRNSLVVTQVALSLLMLIAAGLFLRSLHNSQQVSPGFNPDGVLLASYDLSPNGYSEEAGIHFHRQALERVRALPGVTVASAARRVPLGFDGASTVAITVEGYVPQPNEQLNTPLNLVGPGYFATVQMPLLAGREFSEHDTKDRPAVAIVNETMARRYWNRTDVVGERFRVGASTLDIVGVVPTGKYQTLGERPRPYFYAPMAQRYPSQGVLHVRTNGDPAQLAPAVRDALASLDVNIPLYDVKTLRSHMLFATFTQRLAASMLGGFGILALTLAGIGLYSVMAYAVSQRTREVGIRMALGAQPSDVLRLIVRQGMTLLAIGLAVGLAMAFGAMPLMAPVLIGVDGRDPVTFGAVSLLLAVVALAASYIPARRAAAVDPIVALRR